MQDIRKPYTRSRSSNDLQSRVERFEAARYRRDDYEEDEPVQIPVKKTRRDVNDMDMYPKRIRDEELYEDEGFTDDAEDQRLYSRNPRLSHPRKNVSSGTIALLVTMVVAVLGVVLYTYVFDSATIKIVPKYKDITDLNKAFIFSRDTLDPTAIPFVTMSVSLSKTKALKASESRKVEAKASGKVTIYNNYDSSPQKLIKNTRLQSSSGKIYRITQSIEVPGKKGVAPGSVDAMVYADSNGAEYNITSTTFSIPGFKGTPRESTFYAKSKTAITGGSSGTMSLASLSDLNAAKDSLAVELDGQVKTEVQKIKKDGYIPMYSATEVVYQDNEDDVLKGITTEYKVTATGNLMLASAPVLASAIAKTLGDYDGAPVRLAYEETLTYTRKQIDHIAATSTFSILVEGKPRVIWESDVLAIKKMVGGKRRDDFKPLMKTINSIESAEINFSPLWLSSFPSDVSKIELIESLPKH